MALTTQHPFTVNEEYVHLRKEAFELVRKGLSDNSTGGERSVAMYALKCIEKDLINEPETLPVL